MSRKSFALALIAGLFLAGPLTAEPDSKKEPPKRSQSDRQQSSSSKDAAAANRPLTVKDISIFTYQPAPTRAIQVRGLANEGLVRLSVNPQGLVTAVKILRSTGNRDFDTDAVEAFRRWRAIRGVAREIDLPVTAVTSGKKAPMRLPLTEGRLDVG
ncbi:MAG TPA: energy transducer TonB [Chthoniobacterales bacterium]|nr:energy transducer TonB [Chthoniobacterales bacterium]